MGDLPALWGGAWEQRAEMQRSWQAYYATCRHIGGEKPCRVKMSPKNPRATKLQLRGRCQLCAWWRKLRVLARFLGYMCILQKRAAERVYAPGGAGFQEAMASFEAYRGRAT